MSLVFSARRRRSDRLEMLFAAVHQSAYGDVAHELALLFGLGTKALVWGFLSQAG